MVSRRLAYDAARRMRKRPQAGASLRETVLRNMPANVAPLFRAADYGLVTSSVARTAENRSLYDDLNLDTFEGNAKYQWIDEKLGWCHLCNEAFGGTLGVHLSDRDHVCLGLFLMLHSQYPRHWGPRACLHAAFEQYSALHDNATGFALTQDHLHCSNDAVRRAELEAILWHLTRGPNKCLDYALQGLAPMGLWVSGERIFKVNLSRLVSMYLPPMAPGVHSTFCQKCWGRSNQERMYEALNVASMHRANGVEPKMVRDSRAFFMRCLICEMHTALDNRRITPTANFLLEEALRRLSFEMIFLQSMYYMNRMQHVVDRLGGAPTLEELHALNSL
jgi:hypothetical protein